MKNKNTDEKTSKQRIMVYGTLRKGWGLHEYMKNFKFLGVGKVHGFEMYSNGYYPMLIKGEEIITGEVYEIENGTNEMAILDRIESAYDRVTIEVDIKGVWYKTDIYLYKGKPEEVKKYYRKIKSGNWNLQTGE